MMGRNHATSGLAVGCWAATVLAPHNPAAALPVAVVVAGYAIAPDLDCHGSTGTRLLGPVTWWLHRGLRGLSLWAYYRTATRADRRRGGGHRALTHTAVFAVALGGVATVTAVVTPWAIAAWLGLGVLFAVAAVGAWVGPVSAAVLMLPVLLHHVTVAGELGAARWWIGAAVALGCLVHILGDAVTVSGVPLLWPVRIGGRRWWDAHLLPYRIRLHTGRRFETVIVAPLLVALTLWSAWAVWPVVDQPAVPVPAAYATR